jgi:hypothetical protein
MGTLTNEKKRILGEQMFVENFKTSKYIAEFYEVSEQTVSRWRKKYKWDDQRAEILASPHKLKKILFAELENIASGGTKKFDADGLYKVFKIIEGLSDRTSVRVCVSVLKELDDFMIDQDHELGIKFIEYHKKFILFKAEHE